MKLKIDLLKMHSDKRGIVFEPIDRDALPAHRNCHVVISEPGVIRGNHYHLKGTETIAVVGPAFLRFKDGKDIYDVDVPVGQVYKFIIPPRVTHAIKNTSPGNNFLIAFNTLAHDSKNPDAISDILIDH